MPIAAPSAASTALTAVCTAATASAGPRGASPAAARTAAPRAARPRTASSFAGATKRTPARSALGERERLALDVPVGVQREAGRSEQDQAEQQELLGVRQARHQRRGGVERVHRGPVIGRDTTKTSHLLGENSRSKSVHQQPRDPPRALGVVGLPDRAQRAEHVAGVHVGADRARGDGGVEQRRDRRRGSAREVSERTFEPPAVSVSSAAAIPRLVAL